MYVKSFLHDLVPIISFLALAYICIHFFTHRRSLSAYQLSVEKSDAILLFILGIIFFSLNILMLHYYFTAEDKTPAFLKSAFEFLLGFPKDKALPIPTWSEVTPEHVIHNARTGMAFGSACLLIAFYKTVRLLVIRSRKKQRWQR